MRGFIWTVRPRIIKLIDVSAVDVLQGCPYDPLVIGRHHYEPDDQRFNDAARIAREIADCTLGRQCQEGLVDTMEVYNEINPHGGRCWEYVEFQLELVEELRKLGIPYVAGSWSVGCPDELHPETGRIVYWDDPRVHELARKLRLWGGLWGLHEYCAPRMDSEFLRYPDDPNIQPEVGGYFTLRFRKMRAQLEDALSPSELPDIVITEFGVDSGAAHWDPGGEGGYHSFGGMDVFLPQLGWYDKYLQEDDYIAGATVFLFDGLEMWESFDVWPDREQYGNYIVGQGWEEQEDGYRSHYVLLPQMDTRQEADWQWYEALRNYIGAFRSTVGQSDDDAMKVHGGLGHTVTAVNPSAERLAMLRAVGGFDIDLVEGSLAEVQELMDWRAEEGARFGHPSEGPPYRELYLKYQTPEIPWCLVAGLVKCESAFDRLACSSAGAWGLGQSMIKTWDAFGHGSPTDPDCMIRFVVDYLVEVRSILPYERRDSWRWLAYGYSAGPSAARDAEDWEDTLEDYRAHAERVERAALEYQESFPNSPAKLRSWISHFVSVIRQEVTK